MYEYKIKKILKIIDGDTLDAEIDLGFNIVITQRIRLAGIDAPETRTKNLEEKVDGLESKRWLEEKLTTSKPMFIRTEKDDKYGRILGWIYIGEDSITVNTHMIREGYAKPFME
jgi:micrococcal nuclease